MLYEVFAVIEDSKTAIVIAVTGTLTVVLTKVVDAMWSSIQEGRRKREKEEDKIEGHLEKRIARLEVENERCERRQKRTARRVRVLENSNTQMKAYMQTLPKDKNLPPYVEIPLSPDEDAEDDVKPSTDVHQKLQIPKVEEHRDGRVS